MSSPILRFAPSPNGHLHLGHAYSALLNATMAAGLGGRLLLRIEDIDVTRCKPAYDAALLEDLAWLDIRFAGEVLRQSTRWPAYASAAARLKDMDLIYPCRCSRADIKAAVADRPDWPRDPDGAPIYPGTCRHLPDSVRRQLLGSGAPIAWRLDTARSVAALGPGAALAWRELDPGTDRAAVDPGRVTAIAATPEAWGDPILIRKEFPASYHLSVVVDDAFQDVGLVVRGRDLYHATSLHRLLQALLDVTAPLYHHHALVNNEAGQKLAKSLGSTSLRDLRRAGLTAAEIRRRLGF